MTIYIVGKLAPNSTHFTRMLIKYVPERCYFRAVPSQNGDKFATFPTPPIVERLFFSCPRSRLRIWSRETGSAVQFRAASACSSPSSGGISFLQDSSRVPRRRPNICSNRHTPSDQSRVYRVTRWRSLPRVRRNWASKPQGSSKRVLPWQVTMDQLICASLSHTQYWYEVVMAC